MTRTIRLALAASVLGALAVPAAAQQTACDRACLIGTMDSYFAALAAHDAGQLTLSNDIKYTENGQSLALTDGLWRTVKALPSYRLDIADTDAGEIATLGIVTEGTNENFISVRLKIENRRITEIENLVVRNVSPPSPLFASREQRSEPFPIFNAIEPEATRSSRSELIAAADAYFTGLDSEVTGANVPFDSECQRLENGSYMANSPIPDAGAMQKLGCKAQFDTGFQVIVSNIRARRYPVVDTERGLVYALAFFDHGGVDDGTGPPGRAAQPPAGPFSQPFSFMIAEVFKLQEGKIRQIEAVLTAVPYGMKSGW